VEIKVAECLAVWQAGQAIQGCHPQAGRQLIHMPDGILKARFERRQAGSALAVDGGLQFGELAGILNAVSGPCAQLAKQGCASHPLVDQTVSPIQRKLAKQFRCWQVRRRDQPGSSYLALDPVGGHPFVEQLQNLLILPRQHFGGAAVSNDDSFNLSQKCRPLV
jgi:hypothetical protein